MNETRGQQEPSMEEILASIRRIISEDGQDPEAAKTNEEEPSSTAPAEQPAAESASSPVKPEAPYRSGAENTEAEKAGTENAGAEILVLTEMLAEDGSVVSLADRAAEDGGDLARAPQPSGLPEPPGDPPSIEEGAEADRTMLAGATRPDQAKKTDGQPQAKADSPSADQQMESDTVSNEARKKLDLVSREAEAASTAALSELARTAMRDKDAPIGGGRMIDDLVREALEPMLRQWLDANLPGLVERLVRSEIQRMVRRAEDGA